MVPSGSSAAPTSTVLQMTRSSGIVCSRYPSGSSDISRPPPWGMPSRNHQGTPFNINTNGVFWPAQRQELRGDFPEVVVFDGNEDRVLGPENVRIVGRADPFRDRTLGGHVT